MLTKTQLIKVILKNAFKMAVALIIAGVIIYVSASQIRKISDSLLEEKTILFVMGRSLEMNSKLQEDFKTVNDGDRKINSALMSSSNILEFVDAMNDLGKKSALSVSLKFNTPVSTPPKYGISIASIDYTANANGDISSFINYLEAFEKIPYFTGLSSLNLTTQGDWQKKNSLISSTGKLYVRAN